MQTLLKKLISFQTDKEHPKEIQKCFAYVSSLLKKSGLMVKTYNSNNKPSLITSYISKKHFKYLLCGHLDVVPATYKNAFTPILRNSKLYGRGAADMKGPCVAMIKLILNKKLKNKDIALMLTCDEEIGGQNGVGYLVNKMNVSCDCAIVPDGGKNFELVLAEKGVLHVKLTAKGKAAHGSRPWAGENALEKLIKTYEIIKKKMPKIDFNNLWMPTVNLGMISGGDSPNKVPSAAIMLLDFRFPENKNKLKIKKILDTACCKVGKVSWEVLVEGDILKTSEKNKYVQKMLKTAKKLKIKMKFDKCHGASDGRYFSSKKIPVLMFAPKSSPAHIDNEWIDLKSLDKFHKLLYTFLLSP